MCLMPTIAAFVIAGGQSSRMGRDKALLELGGQTLLARAVMLARTVSDEVSIVGSRDRIARNQITAELDNTAEGPNRRIAELKIIEDLYPGQGPLAGIHAALLAGNAELNLILGVDTPFLEPRFLRYLVEQAASSGAVVTVPVVGCQSSMIGRRQTRPQPTSDSQQTDNREPKTENPVAVQPLCAVYRREFAAVAEQALRARRNNVVPLFVRVSTRQIGPDELRQLSFDPIMFDNLNTPEDFDAARRRIGF